MKKIMYLLVISIIVIIFAQISIAITITDFFYGENLRNTSIDKSLELFPTDEEITLPQIQDLQGKWTFRNGFTDTSGKNVTTQINGDVWQFHQRIDQNYPGQIYSGRYMSTVDFPFFNQTAPWTIISTFKTPSIDDARKMGNLIPTSYSVWAKSGGWGSTAHITGNDGCSSNNNTNCVWEINLGCNGCKNTATKVQWNTTQQMAVVYYGENITRVYINAVEDSNSPMNFTGYNWSKNSVSLILGMSGAYSSEQSLNKFENLYLWNTTLTAAEITDIWEQTVYDTENDTTAYESLYEIGAYEKNKIYYRDYSLTAIKPTGTSIQTRWRTAQFTPTDCNNETILSCWKFNRKDDLNILENTNDDNIVLHLTFNTADDIMDHSPKSTQITNQNTTMIDGWREKGRYVPSGSYYNGSTFLYYVLSAKDEDYLDIQNDSGLSLSAWFKFERLPAGSTENCIVCKRNVTVAPYQGYETYIKLATGQVCSQIRNGTGSSSEQCTSSGRWYNDTQWHWLGVSYGTNHVFMVDGELVANVTNIERKGVQNDLDLHIGKTANFPWYSLGSFDNIRVYNAILSYDELKKIYVKEYGLDDEKETNNAFINQTLNKSSGQYTDDISIQCDGIKTILVSNMNSTSTEIIYNDGTWKHTIITPAQNYTNGQTTGDIQIPFNTTHICVYPNGTISTEKIDTLILHNTTLTLWDAQEKYADFQEWTGWSDGTTVDVKRDADAIKIQVKLVTENKVETPILTQMNIQNQDQSEPITYPEFSSITIFLAIFLATVWILYIRKR